MLSAIPILFEDQDMVVINKPAGTVVNRSHTTPAHTLQDWMEERYHFGTKTTNTWENANWEKLVPPDFSTEFGTPLEIFAERVGVVHRLDKETSGCLVLAKNPGALVKLLKQFKDRQVSKKYLALVHGKFSITEGKLSFPVGRASQDRLRFAVTATGREAITQYKVIRFFAHFDTQAWLKLAQAELTSQLNYQKALVKHPLFPYLDKLMQGKSLDKIFRVYQGFSLVECWPKTGRTHQIRVHMKHLHHPLVGDAVYVGKGRQKLDALWCPRHFLHAANLTFTHPVTDQIQTVEAPLPPDLEQALTLLSE